MVRSGSIGGIDKRTDDPLQLFKTQFMDVDILDLTHRGYGKRHTLFLVVTSQPSIIQVFLLSNGPSGR